ncbi:hypothetical protein [Pararhizobium haloflavum]|nr:hypothetical protein [Pararhizobium haloflavum]
MKTSTAAIYLTAELAAAAFHFLRFIGVMMVGFLPRLSREGARRSAL